MHSSDLFGPRGRGARLSLIAGLLLLILGAASSSVPAQLPAPSGPPERQPLPADQTPLTVAPSVQTDSAIRTTLSLDSALQLASRQLSNLQRAKLDELIAAEDVIQARQAYLPRITATLGPVYNSPSPGLTSTNAPATASFINANAVTEYGAFAGISGDLDLNGRLRASLDRNRALLEAARAGTAVELRALVLALDESYYGLALASGRRESAELSLAATEEFAHTTELLANGGEVPRVDLIRARLQLVTREDELAQARAAEEVAANGLRVLVGYEAGQPIYAASLETTLPNLSQVYELTPTGIPQRPEITQLEALQEAARKESRIAQSELFPQLSYSINGGIDTDSLRTEPIRDHSGVLASVTVTIPLFDWGTSRSRERQARLRAESLESQRKLALRSFTQQFYSARSQALTAASRVDLLREGLQDAERNVDVSIARYRAGEAPILEVTDAQNTLTSLRVSYFQALFDYQLARSRLVQAAGP